MLVEEIAAALVAQGRAEAFQWLAEALREGSLLDDLIATLRNLSASEREVVEDALVNLGAQHGAQ